MDAMEYEDSDAATGSTEVPKNHCFGGRICPWCIIGCSHEKHGDIKQAEIHFVEALGEARRLPTDQDFNNIQDDCLVQVRRYSLLSCAVQVLKCKPTKADLKEIDMMIERGYIPQRDKWPTFARSSREWVAPPPPPEPSSASTADEASDEEDEATAEEKKPWYDAPRDCSSRRAESWVRPKRGKDRIIECLTSKRKNQWTPLPDWVTEKLLEVYDQEEIGATVHKIALWIDGLQQLYTYRVEGGPWLTQWNENYPDNAPRSVRVKLVEQKDVGNWSW